MARGLPPLNWFRVFEAAARHLKFTAAAEELGLTQSAVSQQIQSLEMRLGVQLFLRNPRGLTLTDAGRKLVPKVSTSIENLRTAAEMFDLGPSHDVLTVATSVSVAQWILAPHIHQFSEQHPRLKIRLLSTIWADDFKSSVADVEVRFGSKSQVGQGAMRLEPDGLIAVGAPGLDLPIDHAPLIEAVGTSEGWRHWNAAQGHSQTLEPSLFVDSYGMAVTLAQQGAGIALVSLLIAQPLLAQGKLLQVHPASIPATEGYFLAYKSENRTAVDFKDWLCSLVA